MRQVRLCLLCTYTSLIDYIKPTYVAETSWDAESSNYFNSPAAVCTC